MKNIKVVVFFIIIASAITSYSAAPSIEWSRQYNISETSQHDAYACAIDTLGNIYVVGKVQEQVGTNDNILVLKYNSSGDTLWHWYYDSGNYDAANDCVINNMQQLYVAGSINNKAALLKFDQNGDTLWTRVINDPKYNGKSCALDEANNIYLAGDYDNGTTLIPFIKKFSPQGDSLWLKTILLETYTFDYYMTADCVLDSNMNIYFTGSTSTHGSFLAKCNNLGDTLWTRFRNIADTVNEAGQECHIDSEGNIYVSGEYFYPGSPSPPYLAMKYDSEGNIIWNNMQSNMNISMVLGHKSALDDQGNLYVTGQSAMIKYNSQGDTVWSFWIGSGASGYDCELAPSGELVLCGKINDNGIDYFLINKYQAETGVAGDKPKELSVVDQSSYLAYPNPFKSYAKVKGLEEQELFVYNILGQKVQACKGSKIGEKLAPGIYFAIKAKLPQIKPVKLIKIK